MASVTFFVLVRRARRSLDRFQPSTICCNLKRAEAKITLASLAYNMHRLIFHGRGSQGVAVPEGRECRRKSAERRPERLAITPDPTPHVHVRSDGGLMEVPTSILRTNPYAASAKHGIGTPVKRGEHVELDELSIELPLFSVNLICAWMCLGAAEGGQR